MWMGEFDGAFNEWLKVWNSTDQPINWTNWTITSFRGGDLLGWEIFRGRERDGKYEKINGKIIQPKGDVGAPQAYEYADPIQNLEQGEVHYYLESISLGGERDRSTIVTVIIDPTAVSLIERITLWGKIKVRKN